jgi:methylthioribose-1-phosphate isomerase
MIKTIQWTDSGVFLLDQTKLPSQETYLGCRTWEEVADAIKRMVVRGAPAIGIAAAMGIALGTRDADASHAAELRRAFEHICEEMAETRPTAVNLFWAIRRMRQRFEQCSELPVERIRQELIAEAQRILIEDLAVNEAISKHGATLLPSSGGVLTHCNAGALATAGGYGTALGAIRAAIESGKKLTVYADETRPLLQGSRLTAWELMKDGIPTTVISDNMAGAIMQQGKIQAVVVGADRVAANGDVANKIGTYVLAVLAREHNIPFYVAAPWSSIDMECSDGEHIPIERRPQREVTHLGGSCIVPEEVKIENPAFDVTPARYITAILTERGIVRPPYAESLKRLAAAGDVFAADSLPRAKSRGG